MTFKPLSDHVLLKLDTKVRTDSPLILIHTTKADPKFAEVINIGPLVTDLFIGDYVVWSRWSFKELEYDGEKYHLVKQEEIVAVIDDPESGKYR
jgi:chaperonin GroES